MTTKYMIPKTALSMAVLGLTSLHSYADGPIGKSARPNILFIAVAFSVGGLLIIKTL